MSPGILRSVAPAILWLALGNGTVLNPTRDAILTGTTPQPVLTEWNLDGLGNFSGGDATSGSVVTSTDGLITGTIHHTTNFANEIASLETGDGVNAPVSTTFTYDANGNLTNDGQYIYTYDAFNRLISAIDDPDGVAPDTVLYTPQDANYNVTALLDANGDVLEQYAYTPYGQIVARDDLTALGDPLTPQNRIGHQGLFFDRYNFPANPLTDSPFDTAALGLYYNRNRFYSPALGRYLRNDPNASDKVAALVRFSCLIFSRGSTPIALVETNAAKLKGLQTPFEDLSKAARTTLRELTALLDPLGRLAARSRCGRSDALAKRQVSPAPRDLRLPKAGDVLSREYKGRDITVRVLESGFEFDGRRFRSLSAVAKAVTGAHWNGLLFFGLVRQER